MEDGFVKVISPIEDTPAFRAGVKPNDLIIKLDDTPVKGMTLNDAVKRMRGKPNTQITLTITRKGESGPIVVTLTRAIIKVQSITSKMYEPGYAWVRVRAFQEGTPESLVKHLNDLFKQGQVKGLVLDLRNDPGGLLHGAVRGQRGLSAAEEPRRLDRRPRRRCEEEVLRLAGRLRAPQRGCAEVAAGRSEDRADGGAGERRLRFRL